MSEIEKSIYNIISQYPEGYGPYTDKEVFITNAVKKYLKKKDIAQYSCELDLMFENPSCEIFSFSCCWIENGELKAILNQEISRY